MESRRPRRGKQRTALIEANAHSRTTTCTHDQTVACAHVSRRWTRERARAHVCESAIDPIPGVDPSASSSPSLPRSVARSLARSQCLSISFSHPRDIRIPVPSSRERKREEGAYRRTFTMASSLLLLQQQQHAVCLSACVRVRRGTYISRTRPHNTARALCV